LVNLGKLDASKDCRINDAVMVNCINLESINASSKLKITNVNHMMNLKNLMLLVIILF